jgi:hypothetical protein
MRELPALVTALEPDGFVQLLESGAVRIRADGWTMAEIGNGGLVPNRPQQLPPLSYAFSPVVPAEEGRHAHISTRLGEIRAMGLDRRTSQSVRRAIVDALTPFPENAGRAAFAALSLDLTGNLNLVRAATSASLSKELGRPVVAGDFEIRIEREDDYVFRAVTDIQRRLGLSAEAADKAVEKALLAIAGLNQRIEDMDSYQAVSGFRDGELLIPEQKFAFLARQLDPQAQEDRFGRVITLGDLPDPETIEGTVNLERLLTIRNTAELREFRSWLRTLDNVSDDEIADMLGSVRARVSEAVHSRVGKGVRFVVSTAAGLIPVAGPIAGPVLSALDSFLLEKVIPEPGPVSFISTAYPSIFETN